MMSAIAPSQGALYRSRSPLWPPAGFASISPSPLPIPAPTSLKSPTKPAAVMLEEIVAREASGSGSSSRSRRAHSVSQSNQSHPRQAPMEHPLPPDPPIVSLYERMNSNSSASASASSSSSATRSKAPQDSYSHPSERSVSPQQSSSRHDRPSSRSDSRGQTTRDPNSTTRKTKQGPSLQRRLLSELLNFHPHLHSNSSTRAYEDEQTRYSNDKEEDPSPTESHPNRQPHESHTHTHTHAHTHSQSHRSRGSSESISAMLIMTSERLHAETARANAAEKHITEVMSLFKNTHEQKVKLERELAHVREELGMYKIQLDVAQKEIFRAQETVDRVDRQRVEAEEAAVRARERNRKLVEARAVDQAMEEGRRLGYEEGLKQGRMIAEASVREEDYFSYRPPKRPWSARPEEAGEQGSYGSSKSGSSQSSRSHRSSGRSIQRPPSVPPSGRRSVPPDVAKYGGRLPVPTITTPAPIRVPSTQPQPPPSMPPQQSSDIPHAHNNARSRSNSRVGPESITVQGPNAPTRPIPTYNRSPSLSHRSIVLPPDNFIPVLNEDSTITLPPPHELSIPVPAEASSLAPAPAPVPPAPRARSSSRAGDQGPSGPSNRSRDYAYPLHDDRARRHPPPTTTTTAKPMSIASRDSTRISDLDLVSPPLYRDEVGERERSERYKAKQRQRSASAAAQYQPSTERVEHWRTGSKDYGRPTTPVSPTPRREPPDPNRIVPMTESQRTTSPEPRSPGIYSNRPPRRPREVVMPIPLGDQLLQFNTSANAGPSRPNTVNRPRSSSGPHSLAPKTPPYAVRTVSNTTVPGIEVVTPSTHSATSEKTIIDHILLTPEHANRPVQLPPQQKPLTYDHPEITISPGGGESISAVLPDNNLPPGFVPLSPIPGMANLNPYPPGFAPSLPKDMSATGMRPTYMYPSSPLVRPTA